MSSFREIRIGDLFEGKNGHPRYIRDYLDEHPGTHPVYSASLTKPFGFVDSFDYDGTFLTWVMNGYGGRVQEVAGKFSANRDRGVFVPREDAEIPDLTYLRHAMEPQLTAAAVGRRVDGNLNEYTKIYPRTAEEVTISVPVTDAGDLDLKLMEEIGGKLRRVEEAQAGVERAREPLFDAVLVPEVPNPFATVELGNEKLFSRSIGQRVLTDEHEPTGIPVYSANVLVPFGRISKSNLTGGFDKPSLLWGIDGNFDWNLVPSGVVFATTDHAGRLQVLDEDLDPEYVFRYLQLTRERYGFDRVFRANLRNLASVEVRVPLTQTGAFSLKRQKELACEWRKRTEMQEGVLAALDDVLKARISVES